MDYIITTHVRDLMEKEEKSKKEMLILCASDIISMGEEAELLVGGKNYNTAYINAIADIQAPQFRAISAKAFHILLDETTVNGSLIRTLVDKEYSRTDWDDPEISGDQEFLQKFVRNLGLQIRTADSEQPAPRTKLRTFINNVVDGFATTTENIDHLRKRSVIVQSAILSVDLPDVVREAVSQAYEEICSIAGEEISVAVRSSAAGEDSRKKAFAGLQDTYLNIKGREAVLKAYHWDCASAYNLRSMTYRREAILDATLLSEETGDERIAQLAKEEWAIENTSLSVCIMQMINPVISGTAFSADTATGFQGAKECKFVSIDASYGLGESVVGGMVTPDKFYAFQTPQGQFVVLRYMGSKEYKIVYDERGGTKIENVPEEEIYEWSLTEEQIKAVAQGVCAVSKAYNCIIVDTEFCFDANNVLWFVQARPETRWNEELEKHPHTIFMKRKELDPIALTNASLLLEGNGASRGAGSGTVRFLRSALELNKVTKGDILVAERTDPDMVPGMRIASAILANVGGDTSHAAITSRELGIPAVIGIQRLEALRSLDGLEVTVDGTHGKVYKGDLPLREYGSAIDISSIPQTKTRVGLILADVGQSLFLSRLREVEDFEIGLLRAEFMLGNIGVHPSALEAFDNGTLRQRVEEKLAILEQRLTKLVKRQLSDGHISLGFNLRQYVAILTGLDKELEKANALDARGSEALHQQQNLIRSIEHKIDEHTEIAFSNIDILQSSPYIEEHICAMYSDSSVPFDITTHAKEVEKNPAVIDHITRIRSIRDKLAITSDIQKEKEELLSVEEKIKQIITARGAKSGKEHYIQTLSQGLALFALAFYNKPILYRTTDFKSNEYHNLLGGMLFEKVEDNPMLGYRGISRGIHTWEAEAFKKARLEYGGINLQIMLPFVRTIEEARAIKEYLRSVHGIESGKDGLRIFLMSEIPANAILAKQFITEFDGLSIGSNDMTQMILGTDRDNPDLQDIYDEEDPAVIWAILVTIFTGQKYRKKIGFCGQGVSNSPILRGIVTMAGITVASVVPDTYLQTKQDIANIEQEGLTIHTLSHWLQTQYLQRIHSIAHQYGYHEIENESSIEHIEQWYHQQLAHYHLVMRNHIHSPDYTMYEEQVNLLRKRLHKAIIYARWDWEETIQDALRSAGFSSYEEQQQACIQQRELLYK